MIKIKTKKNKTAISMRPIKRRSFSVKKLFFWLLFFCFSGVVIWALFFSEFTQISLIEIEAVNFDQKIIDAVIQEEAHGKYFDFLSKGNIFVFPRNKIVKNLKKENLLLDEIEIDKVFPNKIVAKAWGREGVFIWSSQSRRYLIDKTGTLFSEISDEKIDNFESDFFIVHDESTRVFSVGEKAVSENLAGFFVKVIPALEEEVKIKFEKELYTPALVSDEIRLKAKDGWALYLNTSRPLERQLASLKAFLEKQLEEGDLAKLEYVDLRLKGKILYKLRQEKQNTRDEDEDEDEEGETLRPET